MRLVLGRREAVASPRDDALPALWIGKRPERSRVRSLRSVLRLSDRAVKLHISTLAQPRGIKLAVLRRRGQGDQEYSSRMDDSMRSFWATWHDAYDDPESDLSQRLIAVQRRLSVAIDESPPGAVRVISLHIQGFAVANSSSRYIAEHPRTRPSLRSRTRPADNVPWA